MAVAGHDAGAGRRHQGKPGKLSADPERLTRIEHEAKLLATLNHPHIVTVNPQAGDGFIDWEWLAAQPALQDTGFVRHIRLSEPIEVIMNGRFPLVWSGRRFDALRRARAGRRL